MNDTSSTRTHTLRACSDVLDNNVYRVTVGESEYKRTVPSREYYVHQWNWDSATHALGLVHISWERALDELSALLAGQWENGMVPHIVFNPNERNYFPGPDFWDIAHCSPAGIRTSGICQPPMLGISVPYVAKKILSSCTSEDLPLYRERLSKVLDQSFHYLKYLKHYRDREDSGLLTIIHPWESGLDNAPTWDDGLAAPEFKKESLPEHVIALVDQHRKDLIADAANVSQRPEQKKYYDYMLLVDQCNKLKWNYDDIVTQSYFQIKDVLFTSLFAAGCEAMADFFESQLAEQFQLHNKDRALILRDWRNKSHKGLSLCWDDACGGYLCQNSRKPDANSQTGLAPIKVDTISKFMPLLIGLPSQKQLHIMLQDLSHPDSYGTSFPVPSTSLSAVDSYGNPLFEVARYWRGPTWPVTNMLLIMGLTRYMDTTPAADKQRTRILDSTMELAESIGLREYYDPLAGARDKKEIGFGNFSWTAAIYIYLHNEYIVGNADPRVFNLNH